MSIIELNLITHPFDLISLLVNSDDSLLKLLLEVAICVRIRKPPKLVSIAGERSGNPEVKQLIFDDDPLFPPGSPLEGGDPLS